MNYCPNYLPSVLIKVCSKTRLQTFVMLSMALSTFCPHQWPLWLLLPPSCPTVISSQCWEGRTRLGGEGQWVRDRKPRHSPWSVCESHRNGQDHTPDPQCCWQIPVGLCKVYGLMPGQSQDLGYISLNLGFFWKSATSAHLSTHLRIMGSSLHKFWKCIWYFCSLSICNQSLSPVIFLKSFVSWPLVLWPENALRECCSLEVCSSVEDSRFLRVV